MRSLTLISFLAVPSALCYAQEASQDSLRVQVLDEVVVESQLQYTSASCSTYIPTSRQKNASQTATDLLNRMAIPQLRLQPGESTSVQTVSGQAASIFIDYQPATAEDLAGMRTTDVKRVEYLDFPSDPRFQGCAHVVNFIMQKYEYGGYLKADATEFFIANSGQLNLFAKFQYRRMTFDLAAGGYYSNASHDYANTTEVFRLPVADGSPIALTRISETTYSKMKRRYAWPTFKALYSSDNITLRNTVGINFDKYPTHDSEGTVGYSSEDFAKTSYHSESSHKTSSITYNGNWNFILPKGNSINFAPYYSFSHNTSRSRYEEEQLADIILNGANDKTHQASGNLRFVHSFGKGGQLTAATTASYADSRTTYTGTASATDHIVSAKFFPSVEYSFSTESLNLYAGVGLVYSYSRLGEAKEETTDPFCNLYLSYSFNGKHIVSGDIRYSTLTPASSLRSQVIIQSYPLMSYTGNPTLVAPEFIDADITYVWLPSNILNLSVSGNLSTVNNRYAYCYTPGADGILRTIEQPCGKYLNASVGGYAVVRPFGESLQLVAQVSERFVRNGAPYNYFKRHFSFGLQAIYYLDNWNFGAYYVSKDASPEGFSSGAWRSERDYYAIWAGWGNASWNLKALISAPFRWDWRSSTSSLHSQFYDVITDTYNANNHCFISLSATYTFGFGKKINRGDEASQQQGAASGILK